MARVPVSRYQKTVCVCRCIILNVDRRIVYRVPLPDLWEPCAIMRVCVSQWKSSRCRRDEKIDGSKNDGWVRTVIPRGNWFPTYCRPERKAISIVHWQIPSAVLLNFYCDRRPADGIYKGILVLSGILAVNTRRNYSKRTTSMRGTMTGLAQ